LFFRKNFRNIVRPEKGRWPVPGRNQKGEGGKASRLDVRQGEGRRRGSREAALALDPADKRADVPFGIQKKTDLGGEDTTTARRLC